jgi:hypothetical protein
LDKGREREKSGIMPNLGWGRMVAPFAIEVRYLYLCFSVLWKKITGAQRWYLIRMTWVQFRHH